MSSDRSAADAVGPGSGFRNELTRQNRPVQGRLAARQGKFLTILSAELGPAVATAERVPDETRWRAVVQRRSA